MDEFEVEDDDWLAGLIEEERGDTLRGAGGVDLDGEWLGSHAKNPGGRGRAPAPRGNLATPMKSDRIRTSLYPDPVPGNGATL